MALHFRAVDQPVRRGFRRGQGRECALVVISGLFLTLIAPPADPDEIQRTVGRDTVQPSGETGARFVAVDLLPGPQEGILHHVFRVLFVSRHAISQTEDRPAVALYQESKRTTIARPRPFEGAAVLFFHPAFRLRIRKVVRGGCTTCQPVSRGAVGTRSSQGFRKLTAEGLQVRLRDASCQGASYGIQPVSCRCQWS